MTGKRKKPHSRKPNGPNFENSICGWRILVALLLKVSVQGVRRIDR